MTAGHTTVKLAKALHRRYDGETAVCGKCGTVYLKRNGHSC